MDKAQYYNLRMLEGARGLVVLIALASMVLLSYITAEFLAEKLWPDHTGWILAILAVLALLMLAVAILLIRRVGSSSLSWPSVVGLAVIVFALMSDLFLSRLALEEVLTHQFGDTTQGIITDRRAEPGWRNSTDYYVTYEFSAGGGSETYTESQKITQDKYESLEIGAHVEVVYLPSKPARSFLKESGLAPMGITMLLGPNLTGLLLFPILLSVDVLFRRLISGQYPAAD